MEIEEIETKIEEAWHKTERDFNKLKYLYSEATLKALFYSNLKEPLMKYNDLYPILEKPYNFLGGKRARPVDMVIVYNIDEKDEKRFVALEFKYFSTYTGSGRDNRNLNSIHEDIDRLRLLREKGGFQRGHLCYVECAGEGVRNFKPELFIGDRKQEDWVKGYYREMQGYAWHTHHWKVNIF